MSSESARPDGVAGRLQRLLSESERHAAKYVLILDVKESLDSEVEGRAATSVLKFDAEDLPEKSDFARQAISPGNDDHRFALTACMRKRNHARVFLISRFTDHFHFVGRDSRCVRWLERSPAASYGFFCKENRNVRSVNSASRRLSDIASVVHV